MKILLLNTYDLKGGAARATWRLFRGLRDAGHAVRLLVQEKRSDDPDVVTPRYPLARVMNPLRPFIDFAIPFPFTRKRVLFSTSLLPDTLNREIDRFAPDVVHLNWITGGFMRLESLAAIRQPVIWTLHDMWAFTGGCHYAGECDRYLKACGECPVLHSSRANDLSRMVFTRKSRIYPLIRNLTITTPSRWLAEKVQESPLLGTARIRVVQNGLDTSSFKRSASREEARQKLQLDPGKKIILFGAIRGTENPLKGFRLLVEAMRKMERRDCRLVVFGSSSGGGVDTSGLDVRFLGMVQDQQRLTDLYSAADVVAVPSIQEVFGQAATEAMACGVPVVAFNATGLRDIVIHQETGYLAEPFRPDDLAAGLDWILGDEARRCNLGERARERAVSHFDSKAVVLQMTEIYREAIDA